MKNNYNLDVLKFCFGFQQIKTISHFFIGKGKLENKTKLKTKKIKTVNQVYALD